MGNVHANILNLNLNFEGTQISAKTLPNSGQNQFENVHAILLNTM